MKQLLKTVDDPLPKQVASAELLLMLCLAVALVALFGTDLKFNDTHVELVYAEERETAQQEAIERDEILWFARAIYSESQYVAEQRYVAWVVRNRVESPQYPDTYEGVVVQPHQFSGLNHYDKLYETNISRDYGVGNRVWENALAVATEVYRADDTARLLSRDVMHFYSPVAVAAPKWTEGKMPVKTLPGKKGVRFAFYSGIK